jgi:hypothetical protein
MLQMLVRRLSRLAVAFVADPNCLAISEAPLSALHAKRLQRFDPSLAEVNQPDPVESLTPHFLPRQERFGSRRRFQAPALVAALTCFRSS